MGGSRAIGCMGALIVVGLAATLTALAPRPAAAAVPEPDYALSSDVDLCGEQRVGTLTIPPGRTLGVATAADASPLLPSRPGDPPKPGCPAGSVGELTIVADRIVNNGTIDGSGTQAVGLQPQDGPGAIYTGLPPSGNSGGGHRGTGGPGSVGSSGAAFGSATAEPVTERGMPGAGTSPGAGGAAIVLRVADRIISPGAIRADGTTGGSDISGTCGGDDVLFVGNHAPGGGGAGGGIVLAARHLEISGPIDARGGAGGFGRAGGGGGGGGGTVKLIAPVQILTAGFSVNVSAGTSGGACTSGALPSPPPSPGSPGVIGARVDVTQPVATLHDPAAFWTRNSVSVPLDASGSYSGSSPSGFDVYVCGLRSSSSSPPLTANYSVPSVNSASDPCGSALQLATKSFFVFEISPGDANGFVNVPLSGSGNDGYWGVWAVAVRGSAPSAPPAQVQTVFGIDNTAPNVAVTSPAPSFQTTSASVPLSFSAADATPFGVPSGIATIECRNQMPVATSYEPCTSGEDFALSPGYGSKEVGLRVTDVAGNQSTTTVRGAFVNSPPSVAAAEPATTVAEGMTATMTGTFADAEEVLLSASAGGIEITGPGTWSWSLGTTDGPAQSQTVSVTATDALGASNQTSFGLVVDNVAPAVELSWPPAGSSYDVGETVAATASYTDEGTGDSHTATVHWGDGTSDAASVTGAAGSGSAGATHAYAAAGSYVITVTVTDDDGGSGTATRTVDVARIETELVAEPVIVRVGSGIWLNLLTLQARLTNADTGAPIAGEEVTMTVPIFGRGSVVVCTAVTRSDGRATCSGLSRPLLIVINGGYRATYTGSPTYVASTAQGSLAIVLVRFGLLSWLAVR